MKWSKHDEEALLKYYPVGGAKETQKHLETNRGLRVIAAKAARMGIGIDGRRYKRFESTEHIDKQIKKAYASGKHGEVKALARRIMRPYSWVKYRAAVLGVSLPRNIGEWEGKEIAIIEEHENLGPAEIQRKLKRAGYQRSIGAISRKKWALGLSTVDEDYLTKNTLCGLLGIDHGVIERWIDKGWINPRRRVNCEGEKNDWTWFHVSDVRDFIVNNTAHFDHRKCDKYFLVDVLVDSRKGRKAA